MPKVRMIILAVAVLANGLAAQFAVDQLSRPGNYESRRASSYDRTGANADYRHLRPG